MCVCVCVCERGIVYSIRGGSGPKAFVRARRLHHSPRPSGGRGATSRRAFFVGPGLARVRFFSFQFVNKTRVLK